MKHVFRAVVDEVPEPGGLVAVGSDDARHMVRVARRGLGDAVEVIDSTGATWPGRIAELGPPLRIRVGTAPRIAPVGAAVDLFVGTLEWGRFDLLVEKCTELGVGALTMFTSERAGRRVDQHGFDRRRERLERLSVAAAKQSGSGLRPRLRGLVPFSTVIAEIEPQAGFLLDRRAERGLGDTVRALHPGRASIVVGSDAGFSAAEVELARGAGVEVCGLGGATLRAETAALVAVAVAADALGSLGAG